MANGDEAYGAFLPPYLGPDLGSGPGPDLGPGPHLVRDLLATGLTRGRLRWMLQRGELERVHRGIVVVATGQKDAVAPGTTFSSDDDHVRAVRQALRAVPDGAVVSHESAAAVHGIPTLRRPTQVSVLVPGQANRRDGVILVRGTSAPDRHVTTVEGIRVTTVERTAVDCARGLPLPEALVSLDAAARLLVVTRWYGADTEMLRSLVHHPSVRGWVQSRLEDAWHSVFGWPGSRAVREALPIVDPASESPLESRSRAWFAQGGVPRPDVGRRVTGASGRCYYADFCWDAARLVGEADGWTKYGADTVTMRRTVAAERSRQQDLERRGWRVVRWSSDDDRDTVVRRVNEALAAATRPRRAV